MRQHIIYSSITDPHQPQHDPTNQKIKVYNMGIKNIIEQTGALIYVWLYALLLWVGMFNCLSETSNVHCPTYWMVFGTTPDTSQFIHYTFWDHINYHDTEKMFTITK